MDVLNVVWRHKVREMMFISNITIWQCSHRRNHHSLRPAASLSPQRRRSKNWRAAVSAVHLTPQSRKFLSLASIFNYTKLNLAWKFPCEFYIYLLPCSQCVNINFHRWYREGSNTPLQAIVNRGGSKDHQTTSTLTITPTKEDDGARFRCVVFNRAMKDGEKYETTVTLSVNCE